MASTTAVFSAMDCSTFTWAREKLERPRQLRSDQYPEGLPSVFEKNADVATAKRFTDLHPIPIASFLANLLIMAVSFGTASLAENSLRYIRWKLASYVSFAERPGVEAYDYVACFFGGRQS